jgi:hypothetical protein
MAFVEKDDFNGHIRENILDDLTNVDDDIILKQSNRAINFMSGFLNNRYDVENIFNKTGNDRDTVVLGYCIDITIYYMHRLMNYRKVPRDRADAYNEAKQWLEDVSALKINPVGLPFLTNNTKTYVQWGSNPKRVNHI